MLVKIILALVIACMFMGGLGVAGGITGLRTAIADKQIVSNSAMLDKAIINWYTAHDYELPESLSKEMLSIMGLRDIDLSKFTYTKLSDNKFRLVANLSGKKTENSVNSDRDLPLKPSQDAPSNIGGVNSGSTTSPGTESKPDGSTNGSTTTPDTGESGGSSGGSGSTAGGGSGSTTTPDSSESGSSGGSNIVTGNIGDGMVLVRSNGSIESTFDFGDGANYIIKLNNSDNAMCTKFLEGFVTFKLSYIGHRYNLVNMTTGESLLNFKSGGLGGLVCRVTFTKVS